MLKTRESKDIVIRLFNDGNFGLEDAYSLYQEGYVLICANGQVVDICEEVD